MEALLRISNRLGINSQHNAVPGIHYSAIMETRSPLPTFFDRNQDPYCFRRDLEFIYVFPDPAPDPVRQPANSNSRVVQARYRSLAEISSLEHQEHMFTLQYSNATFNDKAQLREKGLPRRCAIFERCFSRCATDSLEIRMPRSCSRFHTRLLTNVHAIMDYRFLHDCLIVLLTSWPAYAMSNEWWWHRRNHGITPSLTQHVYLHSR